MRDSWYAVRVVGAYIVTFLVAAALCAGWLSVVGRFTGLRIPPADLAIIVVLCSGLGLLPGFGWLLGMVILWLLLTRVERADVWPDAIVMAGGSAFIWLVTAATVFALAS